MGIMSNLRRMLLEKATSLYGPFLGAGIRLAEISPDHRYCRVEMPLTFYNRNYVGTQFGGSLYAMADPWFMLMLIKNLGPDYLVWDKSASINFRRPGRGRVTAEFRLEQGVVDGIRAELESAPKTDRTFTAEIRDDAGLLIADVVKVVNIRKKANPR